MADTTGASALQVKLWESRFFTEYVQENLFSQFMGTSENAVIQVRQELGTKKGKSITFAKVDRLTGSGVTGSSTLEGNEEAMDDRSMEVVIDKIRNAVRISEIEEKKSAISLHEAARSTLMTWAMEETRDRVILRLGDINGTVFGSADATARDLWLVDNQDRVLFGDQIVNHTSLDHSVATTTIAAADKLSAARLSLMKRIALSANPKIKPIRVKGGKRFYVVFAGPLAFRDLAVDSTITNAQRDVGIRMQNNKLFKGGDIEWDGMIVHQIDDIDQILNVGAGGTVDVAPVYLCGAQALGMAWGKRWKTVKETFDYGDKVGAGVEAIYGLEKLVFGTGSSDLSDLKDNGVMTAWLAATADT